MPGQHLRYCDYCHAALAEGQRWVREKICKTGLDSGGRAYLYYHAELFLGMELSCWEKHQIEREVEQCVVKSEDAGHSMWI